MIAGEFGGARGPAKTFTPINVWDVRLNADRRGDARRCPTGIRRAGRRCCAARCSVNGAHDVGGRRRSSIFDRAGERVAHRGERRRDVRSCSTGEPIDEPIVGYGPFVMNTREEIMTAIKDLQEGRFGTGGVNRPTQPAG